MPSFHYVLEPYTGIKSRYTCPSCGKPRRFTRYVITETGEHIADHVGRCDREDKCGYHMRPTDYFRENPLEAAVTKPSYGLSRLNDQPTKRLTPTLEQHFIDWELVNKTLQVVNFNQNNFLKFLEKKVGRSNMLNCAKRFHIGTSRHWPGATVFWQVDESCKVHTGKVMLYHSETGKRVKEPFNHITWVHKLIDKSSSERQNKTQHNVVQCLFGLHQVSGNVREIVIVESEKTATIASVYLPQYTWMACGGLNMVSEKMLQPVKNYPLILYPDIHALDKWEAKATKLRQYGFTVNVSTLLEKAEFVSSTERDNGLDLADFLLKSLPVKSNLQKLIDRWPMIDQLVERLGLETLN